MNTKFEDLPEPTGNIVYIRRVAMDSLPDEVRAFTWLIDHPIAGPVNLAAPVTTTNAELIRALAHAMRRTTFPIAVP